LEKFDAKSCQATAASTAPETLSPSLGEFLGQLEEILSILGI